MYNAILNNAKNSVKLNVVLSTCKRFVLCNEPGKPWVNTRPSGSFETFANILPGAKVYWLPVRVTQDDTNAVIHCTIADVERVQFNSGCSPFKWLDFSQYSHVLSRKCVHIYDSSGQPVYSLCNGDECEQDMIKYNGIYLAFRDGGYYEMDARRSERHHIERLTLLQGLLLDTAIVRGGV